jgi:hypothetical protein
MEAKYTYIMNNGKQLYRGLKEAQADPKYSKISWFSEDSSTAQKYAFQQGVQVGEIFTYRTLKELKLVNINSMFFRFDFIDKINMAYPNDIFSEDKIQLFSVLGIPDLNSLNEVVDKYFKNKPEFKCRNSTDNETKKIKLFAAYLGGHRLSEYSIDRFFAEKLKELYGQEFDGYIAPLDWVTCFHGKLPSEICLFRPTKSVRLVGKYNKDKNNKNSKKGGNKLDDWTPPWDSHNYVDTETTEEYNQRKLVELRKMGYLRDVVYDEEGELVWPNYEELMDGIQNSRFDSGDPYEIAKKHGYTFIPVEEFENQGGRKKSQRKTKPKDKNKPGASK